MRVIAASPPLLACTDLPGVLVTLAYADPVGQVSLTTRVEDAQALCAVVADLIADVGLVRELHQRIAVSSLGAAPDRQVVVPVEADGGVLITLAVDANSGHRNGSARALIERLVEAAGDEAADEVMNALLGLGGSAESADPASDAAETGSGEAWLRQGG